MNRKKLFDQFLICTLLGLAIVGCGGRIQPVHGNVVFEDGTPAKDLAGFAITFQGIDQPGTAHGTIDADGSFTIGTNTDVDGAALGKYRVALTPPLPEVDKPRPAPIIPERYYQFKESNLEVEIKAGKNTPTLTVERLKSN